MIVKHLTLLLFVGICFVGTIVKAADDEFVRASDDIKRFCDEDDDCNVEGEICVGRNDEKKDFCTKCNVNNNRGCSGRENICRELFFRDADDDDKDYTLGECVECVDDGDCANEEVCNLVSYKCEECVVNSDCSDDRICHSTLNKCVMCETDAHCDTGNVCRDQVCVANGFGLNAVWPNTASAVIFGLLLLALPLNVALSAGQSQVLERAFAAGLNVLQQALSQQ